MSGQHKPHKKGAKSSQKGAKSGARNSICRVALVKNLLKNLNVMKRQKQFYQYQQNEQVPLTSNHWTHNKESTTHTDGN